MGGANLATQTGETVGGCGPSETGGGHASAVPQSRHDLDHASRCLFRLSHTGGVFFCSCGRGGVLVERVGPYAEWGASWSILNSLLRWLAYSARMRGARANARVELAAGSWGLEGSRVQQLPVNSDRVSSCPAAWASACPPRPLALISAEPVALCRGHEQKKSPPRGKGRACFGGHTAMGGGSCK